MAKPLPIVVKSPEVSSPENVREELQRKLDAAPVAHAEALLSLYELVQALHESGTLDILRGLVGASDDILGRLSAALAKPETMRAIRNMIALSRVLASVDPEIIDGLRDAVAETAEKNRHLDGKPPALWKIAKKADSEDSLRALSAATDFLESFGRHLKANSRGKSPA
jgi:uncharacterized protein YjgD (DUF1641 family)